MSKIINLGIFAHVDAGKTSLTERLLFASGAIRRAGRVDDGTAQTDYLDIERRRRISVRSAATSFGWRGAEINIIDTPGHTDFCAEAERPLRAVDAALIVVSAVEGVQARTELSWRLLAERGIPTMFFINKLDRAGADPNGVLSDIRELAPEAELLSRFSGEGSPECSAESLLSGGAARELAALSDEALLDKLLAGKLTDGEAEKALADRTAKRGLFPVLCGSALLGVGITELLDAIVALMPPAQSEGSELSGLVFKVEHEKDGAVAHVRLFSGELHNRDAIETAAGVQKITQIRKFRGRQHEDVGRLSAGDIGALTGVKLRAGEIIGLPSFVPPPLHTTEPLLNVKLAPEDASSFPKLVEAMGELTDEEPLLRPQWVSEKRELTVSVTGPIQIEVLQEMLASRFGISVTAGRPSVIYKETPAASGYGFDSYTMPKPCWAVLKFLIEPLPRGSGVSYSSVVENNKIFYRYQSQVEDAIPRALRQGPRGWEVTDLRITLVDGGHHTIHTHPLDFAVCTPMAMMRGLTDIGTKLLEPILSFRLTVPEESVGKVIFELTKMRAVFSAPVPRRGRVFIEGEFPLAESMEFPTLLPRLTSGLGVLATRFEGYKDCPEGKGEDTPYRGISPLDRAKYILWVRKALDDGQTNL